MSHLQPATPSSPMHTRHGSRSARWTAGFVLAVGFGFMGSALIDASEPPDRMTSVKPAMTAAPATDISGPAAGHAESYEVDIAVRNWAWETPSAERRPATRQDLEELWLAR